MKKITLFFILLFIISCSNKTEETLSFDNSVNDSSNQEKELVTQEKNTHTTSNDHHSKSPTKNNPQEKEKTGSKIIKLELRLTN